jgi:hypothetical protein
MASFTTIGHPVTAAGLIMWLDTVEAVRMHLLSQGWTVDNTQNVPRAISPDGRRAITVNSGDDSTGIASLFVRPKTKRPRGAGSRKLFGALPVFESWKVLPTIGMSNPAARPAGREEWFLLYRIDDGQVRAELSHATAVNPDGTLRDWYTRLIIRFPEDGSSGPRGHAPDVSPDVEVPVLPRAG